jgi:hypothetical protein
MPPVDGHSPNDGVAEIHVIKVEHEDLDPWAGMHPSQS